MNDFERKLSQQPFRTPPPEWRDAILNVPANVIVPEVWTWHNWLWPSPKAWAALAALWLIFAIISLGTGETSSRQTPIAGQPSSTPVTLLAFHQYRNLAYALEIPN